MAKSSCECLVPVAEVAAALGMATEGLAASPEVVEDWAGRAALPVDVARRIVSDHRSERESHARDAAEAAEDAREFAAERQRIGQAAYNEAHERQRRIEVAELRAANMTLMGPYRGSPRCAQAGREAREQVLAEFDAKHAVPA